MSCSIKSARRTRQARLVASNRLTDVFYFHKKAHRCGDEGALGFGGEQRQAERRAGGLAGSDQPAVQGGQAPRAGRGRQGQDTKRAHGNDGHARGHRGAAEAV
eukprot:scaffold98313_cov22-Prasinocladus_malaysianus.AAC.1